MRLVGNVEIPQEAYGGVEIERLTSTLGELKYRGNLTM
jgi:hypothetical protein